MQTFGGLRPLRVRWGSAFRRPFWVSGGASVSVGYNGRWRPGRREATVGPPRDTQWSTNTALPVTTAFAGEPRAGREATAIFSRVGGSNSHEFARV